MGKREQSVWTLADLAINLMFIINMVGVIGLTPLVLGPNRLK